MTSNSLGRRLALLALLMCWLLGGPRTGANRSSFGRSSRRRRILPLCVERSHARRVPVKARDHVAQPKDLR